MSRTLFIVACVAVVGAILYLAKDQFIANGPEPKGEEIPVAHFANTDLAERVLNSDKPVIMDFTASWCPPCQKLKPILHEIELSGQARVVEIDVDKYPKVAQIFGAKSIPHLVFVNDGVAMGSMTGFRDKPTLERAIKEISQ